MQPLLEVNLSRGRIGVELELLIRSDLASPDSWMHYRFKHILAEYGMTYKSDPSIVRNSISSDVYYDDFETANVELEGAEWPGLKVRLTAILGWLKQTDLVWLDRTEHRVVSPELAKTSAHKQLALPRGKLPSNPSCGLHIHFDTAGWFGSVEHAIHFVELWNKAQGFFKQGVLRARYEVPAGSSYNPQGEEYAKFQELNIPPSSVIDNATIKASDKPADQREAVRIQSILKWISRHRYSALNLTMVETRHDIEFRFAHGTLNIETISHWVAILASLIEAGAEQGTTRFASYLAKREPDLAKSHEQRANRLAKGSLQFASPYHPDTYTTRAVKRLLNKPKEQLGQQAIVQQFSRA